MINAYDPNVQAALRAAAQTTAPKSSTPTPTYTPYTSGMPIAEMSAAMAKQAGWMPSTPTPTAQSVPPGYTFPAENIYLTNKPVEEKNWFVRPVLGPLPGGAVLGIGAAFAVVVGLVIKRVVSAS